MLKELAVLISKLSYSEMMKFCESDAHQGYESASSRAKKLSDWADRESRPDVMFAPSGLHGDPSLEDKPF